MKSDKKTPNNEATLTSVVEYGSDGKTPTGIVTLTLVAASPSPGVNANPPGDPSGDAEVIARGIKNPSLASATLLVLTPKKVQQPTGSGPYFLGVLPLQNVALNKDTSPALTLVPSNGVELVSIIEKITTVTVLDQFDHPLDSIYAGVPITEGRGGINQNMSSNGTYQDPIGPIIDSGKSVSKNDPNYQKIVDNWTSAPPPILTGSQEGSLDESTPVEVGGISLNPAIVKRFFYIGSLVDPKGTYNVEILWPDPNH